MTYQESIPIFDFTTGTEINHWKIINDDVMGGVSSSSIVLDDNGNGVFSGEISIENNGGFAMTRLPVSISLNANSKKIILRIKGDGKQYQFRIKANENQRYWYVQSFKTSTDWQLIELNLEDFYSSFRGYKLNKGNFTANKIKEVAILIGNKKEEEFKLTIDYIKTN